MLDPKERQKLDRERPATIIQPGAGWGVGGRHGRVREVPKFKHQKDKKKKKKKLK